MLFQGTSIKKFSSASGANNMPHQFRRLDTRCFIATSETILNIVKNFFSENIPSYSEIFQLHPPPPHSLEVRYGPDCNAAYMHLERSRKKSQHGTRLRSYLGTGLSSQQRYFARQLPIIVFVLE